MGLRIPTAEVLDFCHFVQFLLDYLHAYIYKTCRLKDDFSSLRQQVWRVYSAAKVTLRALQRSDAMVQGSFFLQERKCGKANCRCAQGQLHGSWVISRSVEGKGRTFIVPPHERARLRKLTTEYRRYQRARAVLVKRCQQLLGLVDQIAEKRLINWPEKKVN